MRRTGQPAPAQAASCGMLSPSRRSLKAPGPRQPPAASSRREIEPWLQWPDTATAATTTFYPGPAETASVAGDRNYETRHKRAETILSLIMCSPTLVPLYCLLIDKVGGRITFCVGELILFTDRLRRQICSFTSELHKMTMICRLCQAHSSARLWVAFRIGCDRN